MKKIVLFMLSLLPGVCSQAMTVSTEEGVVTVSLASGEHVYSLTNDEKSEIKNAFDSVNPLKIKLVGQFDSSDLNFDNYNPRPVYLDLTDATFADSNQMLNNLKDNLETLYLPANENFTKVPSNFAQGARNLKTVVFPKNIEEIGYDAFASCPISPLTFPENIKVIRSRAFQDNSSLTSLVIPGTVTSIECQAFTQCNNLTEVTFAEHLGTDGKSDVNMHIAGQAFCNDKQIWDVYVESLGTLVCDAHGFEFDVTNAQTTTGRLGTLHYPIEKIEDYVNLNHQLDIETSKDQGKLQAWLNNHRNYAGNNGWYEFVQSGPTNPQEKTTGMKFLKTFSDYNYARLVPEGVRAYIVNKVERQKDTYVLGLKRLSVIPARTGVILYGNVTGNSLVMTPVNVAGKMKLADGKEVELTVDQMALTRDNWELLQGDDIENFKNYLVPTATAGGKGVEVGPYETDKQGKVTFRNFGMGRFSKTESGKKYMLNEGEITSDYEGFFRLKQSIIPDGKAYLQLSAKEYDDPEGGEALVLCDEDFNKEYDTCGNLIYSSLWWDGRSWNACTTYDWGNRDLNCKINEEQYFVKFKGEPVIEENGDDATMILSARNADEEGCYFTLQGTKVLNPVKSGIYIKNGKKVYVKAGSNN